MKKHLVLVGGGHAHLTVMQRLDDFVSRGHRVTLVSSAPCHYFACMGPGLLGGIYLPAQSRFNLRRMVEDRGGAFLEGEVAHIDAGQRRLTLRDGRQLGYTVVSFNTGSNVPLKGISATRDNVLPVKPIQNLLLAQRQILACRSRRPLQVLVIGGGPAAVEVAGNLCCLAARIHGRLAVGLVAGDRLLARFSDKARRLCRASLERRGVRIREGVRVVAAAQGRARLDDGSELPFDLALCATGVRPSGPFCSSPLPVGKDGGLLVNACLQSVHYPEIFGGGDCITFRDHPLDKACVHAIRQSPVLYRNLMAYLEDQPLLRFSPRDKHLLLLNLGDGRGLLGRGRFALQGRGVFYLKDWIDRCFMHHFQVSGEMRDSEPAAPDA